VGTILGLNDGRIDSDGNALGIVVGVRLMLGPLLGAEEGSLLVVGTSLGFFVGDSDTVGNMLDLKDGAIDLDGNPLGSVVGVRLLPGPILGAEEGSMNIDGVYECLIDGSLDGSGGDGGGVLLTDGSGLASIGLRLGFLVGKCETDADGSELTVGW
jgi:hypothetical protein